MMEAFRSGLRGPRSIALAILACALALRLLIPAGWMPVTDATGTHLVLCSGTGPMEMPGDHAMASMPGMDHHGNGQPHDPGSSEHACPFASLGLAIAAPILPAVVLPALVTAAPVDRRPALVSIGHGLAAPPPPPTGPPALG